MILYCCPSDEGVGLLILHCGLKVFQPRLNVIVLVGYYPTN
jgi:hypothetical protein